MTSRIETVIRRHISNPEPILGAIQDLFFQFVAQTVIGEFEEILAGEQAAFNQEVHEGSLSAAAATAGARDLNRLEALIKDLKEAAMVEENILRRAIENRYMNE